MQHPTIRAVPASGHLQSPNCHHARVGQPRSDVTVGRNYSSSNQNFHIRRKRPSQRGGRRKHLKAQLRRPLCAPRIVLSSGTIHPTDTPTAATLCPKTDRTHYTSTSKTYGTTIMRDLLPTLQLRGPAPIYGRHVPLQYAQTTCDTTPPATVASSLPLFH